MDKYMYNTKYTYPLVTFSNLKIIVESAVMYVWPPCTSLEGTAEEVSIGLGENIGAERENMSLCKYLTSSV